MAKAEKVEFTDEDGLKRLLDEGLSRAYFIFGGEDYLKKFYVGRISSAAVGEGLEGFNLRVLDGKNTDVRGIIGAADTLPVMSERCCVLVKDMDIDALEKEDADALAEAVRNLPRTCVLIFYQETVEPSTAKSSKAMSVISAVRAVGVAAKLDRRGTQGLAALVSSGAKRRGCLISPDTARYLVSFVGDDMNTLLNELEKVCAYAGGGEILRRHIDEACVPTVEAAVFDMVKAIVAGNADRAYELLDILISRKTEPVALMGPMISVYADMYRAKVCIASGGRAEDAAEMFPAAYKGREWKLRAAARDASRLTLGALERSLDELAEADLRIKSFFTDGREQVERCIASLILISRP